MIKSRRRFRVVIELRREVVSLVMTTLGMGYVVAAFLYSQGWWHPSTHTVIYGALFGPGIGLIAAGMRRA